MKPVYTPPQLFPIGVETITYIATDRSGNQANCSFTVSVIGECHLVPLHTLLATSESRDYPSASPKKHNIPRLLKKIKKDVKMSARRETRRLPNNISPLAFYLLFSLLRLPANPGSSLPRICFRLPTRFHSRPDKLHVECFKYKSQRRMQIIPVQTVLSTVNVVRELEPAPHHMAQTPLHPSPPSAISAPTSRLCATAYSCHLV